jgi:hypothetical protein
MSAVGFRRMITKLGKAAKMPFSVHRQMLRHGSGSNSPMTATTPSGCGGEGQAAPDRRNRNAPQSTLNGYAEISLAVITYLKVSGSSESSLSPSTSAWGYMRKPTLGPDEPGSSMSCAKL